LVLAQAQLNKLLAGASQGEITAAQTTVNNAETALKNTQQNLTDIQTKATESLDSAYEDAQDNLNDAYLKAYNIQNFMNYFGGIISYLVFQL
jgi:capsule polysaccharide export protein KpsE/RkpR